MSDRVPDDRPALLEDRVSDIATLMDTVGIGPSGTRGSVGDRSSGSPLRCDTPGENEGGGCIWLVRTNG